MGAGVGVRISFVCGCDGRSSPLLVCKRAVLHAGVTDEGLRALASVGCGKNLMSLTLWGDFLSSCLWFDAVCGRDGMSDACVYDGRSFSSPFVLANTHRAGRGSDR